MLKPRFARARTREARTIRRFARSCVLRTTLGGPLPTGRASVHGLPPPFGGVTPLMHSLTGHSWWRLAHRRTPVSRMFSDFLHQGAGGRRPLAVHYVPECWAP